MAKYLFKGRYTQQGIKGLVAGGGGTARRKAVEELVASVGGSLESMYYCMGADDIFVVVDLPDHASAVAVSMIVGQSGAFEGETVVLLTPEEIDAAAAKAPEYRAPGQ
ncbi:MAG TPA: GYD domain-containing protein [Longimicrobiales bacterium]|nr:GYD domain-containing protein [Longimicrobiales bacterium]